MLKNRVLHVITGLNTGGAERSLCSLLSGGLAQSFKSKVLSLTDEGTFGNRIRKSGVPVTALEMRRGLTSVSAFSRLNRVARDFRPDLIQGWMYHGNVAAWVVRALLPEKPGLAWNIRHSLYDLANEKLLTRQVIHANRLLSSKPDVILYNSYISRQQHEALGFRETHGQTIPNGFDINPLPESLEGRHAIRSKLGIPNEAFLIGHVARLHPMKNHSGFLRAAVAVGRKFYKVHFLLCGRGVVAENQRLASIVPTAMRGRFHFLGERGDVPRLMHAMDVLCNSSSWGEAFPNVLGEAMATGVPCVATDVGDSRAIIGNTGLIVPPMDENALSNALEQMLLMPVAEREALGQGARSRVAFNYSLDAAVKQYVALYEALAVNRCV